VGLGIYQTQALTAVLPRQDHVYITTDEFFCFRNDEFDEMPCKLDSIENPRSLEIPNPTCGWVFPTNISPFPPLLSTFSEIGRLLFLRSDFNSHGL